MIKVLTANGLHGCVTVIVEGVGKQCYPCGAVKWGGVDSMGEVKTSKYPQRRKENRETQGMVKTDKSPQHLMGP